VGLVAVLYLFIMGSVSNYLRTKSNALINITDLDYKINTTGIIAGWDVEARIDDTDRDGDKWTAGATKILFTTTYNNDSDNEIATAFSGGDYSSWIADPDDSTHSTYIDDYGVEFDYNNPSSAPASLELTVPDSIVKPKIYITSGAVTISSGTTAAGGLAPILKDSEVSTVSGSNLVVVGGSCINTVAAKLLNSDAPVCGPDFTASTGVSAGGYIIDTMVSPYNAGKVAMLVAGYEGTDTVAAAQKVVDDSLSPDASAAAIIGPVTA